MLAVLDDVTRMMLRRLRKCGRGAYRRAHWKETFAWHYIQMYDEHLGIVISGVMLTNITRSVIVEWIDR